MPKETIKNLATNICKSIPSLKDACLGLIHDYFDKIYDFIVHDLDAKVCAALGICSQEQIFYREVLQQKSEIWVDRWNYKCFLKEIEHYMILMWMQFLGGILGLWLYKTY